VAELLAIEAVVQAFFKGLHEGDVPLVQKQFIKDAVITGYYEGECIVHELNQYLAVLKQMPSPILLGEDFEMDIAGIETVGSIALVRARYLYEALRFTDYLSLMKIGGEWKVVSRLFHHD
jgi:hypothetical protein